MNPIYSEPAQSWSTSTSEMAGLRPRRFLILANGRKEQAVVHAQQVRASLEAAGAEIVGFDVTGETQFPAGLADLVIVLGGDGAILRAAKQLGPQSVPVLGINMGRLGFLADLNPDEFCARLGPILDGDFTVTRHVVLDCSVTLPGSELNGAPPIVHRALNEIVIAAETPFRMVELLVTIDGEEVVRFSGDGLIVSTPIGSTAHSLSAGGPILVQTLPAVVITPLCPHTLTWRPIVESADRHITIHCKDLEAAASVYIDGQDQVPLHPGEVVELSRSSVDFQLVRMRSHNYYKTLTRKLHWGTGPRPGERHLGSDERPRPMPPS